MKTNVLPDLSPAVHALAAGDYATAEDFLQSLAAGDDPRADTWRLLALAEFRRGDLEPALTNAQRAVAHAPNDALTWNTLAIVHHARGDWRAASSAFENACRLAPDNFQLWANWGKTLVEAEQFQQAIDVLGQALTLDEHAATRKRLARAFVATGRLDDAERLYREQVAKYPTDGDAWFALASLDEHSLADADAAQLRTLESSTPLSDEDLSGIRFALSRHAERRGDFRTAFDLLTKANAAERTHVVWDAAGFSAFVTSVLRAFETASAPRPSSRGAGLIFIVGLPRTGSTFIEQLIGQHTATATGGEMPSLPGILDAESRRRGVDFSAWAARADTADWERLGDAYLAAVAEKRGAATFFTDKRCGNWLYVGAIARMLPAARVIYSCRDAADACFGCFRQRFSVGVQPFSYDLNECVAYWRDCDRAMRFWQQHHAHHIRFQAHEALMQANAEEVTALSRFCGLPALAQTLDFSRATIATASAAQLRSTRTAARSWAALYGVHLAPLHRALQSH